MGRSLTSNQMFVLMSLRRQRLNLLADEIEAAWRNGRSHYIDARETVPAGIRKAMKQGNVEAIDSTSLQRPS